MLQLSTKQSIIHIAQMLIYYEKKYTPLYMYNILGFNISLETKSHAIIH